MKQPNAKIIESIKSILLVVLFFTTVLLLYFFWENATKDPFRFSEMIYGPEVEEVPDLYDTVVPSEITVGFGNQVYTVILDGREDLWKSALQELKAFGDAATQSANLYVGTITKEKFQEAMTYPSIQFQFHYDIPFKEFCDFFGLKKNQGYDLIEGVSTIAYSGLSTESILIHQQNPDRYYAIVADKDYTKFHSMISTIETSGYASYYPASTFFGKGTNNTALFPLALQSDLLEVPYEKEANQQGDTKVRDLAESFFGESFDFTRRMTDAKGDITYMYGYGQKIFTIHADGTFEYKEEAKESSGGSQAKFFDSLDLALKFVAAHGSWNSLDGTDMTAYLRKVVPIGEEKRKGYKFIFGMKIGSQNVYFENSAPIIVEVVNGQVVHYKRDMIDFDKAAADSYSSGDPKNTYDPVTVLTENYEYIYEKLSEAKFELSPITQREAAFDEIAGSITAMEIGYVRPKAAEGEETKLMPCYRISFGRNNTLYFDLFNDAAPIGSESEDVSSGQTQNPNQNPNQNTVPTVQNLNLPQNPQQLQRKELDPAEGQVSGRIKKQGETSAESEG